MAQSLAPRLGAQGVSRFPRTALLAALWLAGCAARAAAHPGTGIVADRARRIYFTDLRQIWRLEPGGRLTVAVPETHTHELFLDEEGNLFGEHLSYEPSAKRWWTSVWRLTPEGKVSQVQRPTQSLRSDFPAVRDRLGNGFYADVNNHLRETSRIYRRSPGGVVALLAGGAWGERDGSGPDARFGSIGGMAAGPDGKLYVADGASIRRVSAEGDVRTIVRDHPLLKRPTLSAGGRSNHLMGLAVDGRGVVFVANHGGRSVLRVSPEGDVRRILRARFPWSPTGVALTGSGDLLVLEYRSGPGAQPVRVRRIAPNGHTTLLTRTEGAS